MRPVRREEFQEWEKDPVTLAVKEAIQERIKGCADQLVSNRFGNKEYDEFMRGMIQAFEDVLNVELDDIKSIEEDEDEV